MSLLQRLEELEEEVRELRAALERRETSMRRDGRCPACGCRSILHAKRVADRAGGTVGPLSVMVVGLFAPQPRGLFECYVCASCGACEWYVAQPGEIEADDDAVTLAEASEPSGGPYR